MPRFAAHWIRLSAVVLLVGSVCTSAGCTTSGGQGEADEDEFIGQPPSPDEDPFSVRGDVRGEAVEATPRGEISEEDFEEPTPRDDLDANPDEWDEALGSGESEEQPDQPQDLPEATESEEASDASPAAQSEGSTTAEPERERPFRCFSCVKICPVDGGCESAKQDVICGWGTHSTREQASRMARAECNAMLELTRKMPVWSRIDGECPTATCRR